MPGLNEFFISPLFDHILLTKGLVLFTLFLLLIRILPDFARNLTLLLTSVALIEIATSPFYTFSFVALTGLLYYGLFWMQWSERKKLYSHLIAATLVVFYFLLRDLPALQGPWTGSNVHKFGIAYALFRLLSVTLHVGEGKPLPADPLEFFVYAFFVPTFFQGPIERLEEFRKNLLNRFQLTWAETGSHLIRIAGAFAKGWAAQRFFTLDWTLYFNYPQTLSYSTLVWGFYANSISFYLVVSAANDLTIACCAIAGYAIHENYNYPYFKKNLAEFWRSWHMTLTRFIRDYVYIPLGGNRKHLYRNILVVFLCIALWHVTSKAFVVWGLWHGLGMCGLKRWQNFWKTIEEKNQPEILLSLRLLARQWPRSTTLLSTLVTFHFVAIGWLPFQGGHPQGISMLLRLISGNHWKLFVW